MPDGPMVAPQGPKTSPRDPKEILNGPRWGQQIFKDAPRRANVEKMEMFKYQSFFDLFHFLSLWRLIMLGVRFIILDFVYVVLEQAEST